MKQLSEYILDIAENSIRANADRVDITLRESADGRFVEMCVKDDGRGMSDEECLLAGNVRFTTKDGDGGFGLLALKAATEQSGGSFFVKSELGIGTEVRASFMRELCPPVGDIADTLMALLASEGKTRIVFRHKRGSCDSVDFDSNLAKAALGGELWSHPKALLIIRDHIKELYGSDYSELFQKG